MKGRIGVKPKVYIETTIISYLAARPSRDVIVAGHQQITHDWWEKRREGFALYASRLSEGFELPRICTPTELMGEDYHVDLEG